MMRYTPLASVCTDCDSWLSLYSSTVQPFSARSLESWTVSKLASYQADPFSTARVGVRGLPGMLPTTIDALALAVWVGLFQEATDVFVTTVPSARLELSVARNFSTTTAPGASAPFTAP